MTTVFSFTKPNDLILEIPPNIQWRSRYQAYLNEICLKAVLPWLKEELTDTAKSLFNASVLSSIWEFINGTPITLGNKRCILIPSEAMDDSELRVPQEWVDIPDWVADYYLAVHVQAEDGWVRVWGFCSHAQLKSDGNYDANTRTYSLDADEIIDIGAIATAYDFETQENTRFKIQQIAQLTPTLAQNLISRLGSLDVMIPRLSVPFQMWAALMQHGGWRKELYQRRQGQSESWSVLQWLRDGITAATEELGWDSSSIQTLAGARGSNNTIAPVFSKQLVIAGQIYRLAVTQQTQAGENAWRFELRSATLGGMLPGGFKIRLLTEDLQSFPNNEDIATTAVESLYVDVALESGEGIVWEIEPLPEDYDREILRF